MFTGIIECLAEVAKTDFEGTNKNFWIKAPIFSELKIDQSVAHNGVCLTVVELTDSLYKVTAIQETLNKTSLGLLAAGDQINLERCMPANGRFDGHIVQGHIDTTALVERIENNQGSWNFHFLLSEPHNGLIVSKGSICVNGVSLTVVDLEDKTFSVSIIPYTYANTCFSQLGLGDIVNIEFDILGKYVSAMLARK